MSNFKKFLNKKISLKVFTEQKPAPGSYEPVLAPVNKPYTFSHPDDGLDFNTLVKVALSRDITPSIDDLIVTPPLIPDFNIQPLIIGGVGFATLDEGLTVLAVIKNLQERVKDLEDRLNIKQ